MANQDRTDFLDLLDFRGCPEEMACQDLRENVEWMEFRECLVQTEHLETSDQMDCLVFLEIVDWKDLVVVLDFQGSMVIQSSVGCLV
jgi:hypothetical protein